MTEDIFGNQDFQPDIQTPNNSIQLPIEVPWIKWDHGKAELAELGGVRKFGGWKTNVDTFNQVSTTHGKSVDWVQNCIESRSSNAGNYQVYALRNIIFSIIGGRKRWKSYTDRKGELKWSKHHQFVAMLARKGEQGIESLFPVGLTFSGWYATAGFDQAIDKWNNAVKNFNPSYSPALFYCSVGTYQDQPVFADENKNTTKPELWEPKEINIDFLKKVWVGEEVKAQMVQLQEQTQEWLTDKKWANAYSEKDNQSEIQSPEAPPNFPEYEPTPPESEIPF